MPAINAVASAICGTHFGDTNEVDSTLTTPARASRFTSSILSVVGTNSFSFCKPSRGPTSTIFTFCGSMPVSFRARGFNSRVSIAAFQIHYAGNRFTARKRPDFLGDLRDAFLAQGEGGDMRRDRDARRMPEGVIDGERLGVEYIERRGGDLAVLHGVEEVVIDQMRAAREVDHIRAVSELAEGPAVENAFSVGRMRQEIDQDVHAVEEG